MMLKKVLKRMSIVVLILVGLLALLVLCSYINHKIQLNKESSFFVPMGQMVEVNGHDISVYSEGNGRQTLVFLSGGGTSSPILDFKSLYSLLSDEYKIVVVEKAGYGFSEDSDVSRDIETIVSETREALLLSGISGPYVLLPHSMSGIEVLYWAQQYPEEISAIIGLDMAVPSAYEAMQINIFLQRVVSFAARTGITRIAPSFAESDAIKYGILTAEEKDLYRVIFYRRTATNSMLNEAAMIQENAQIVDNGGAISTPILMFASNGSGGTGFDEGTWIGFQRNFADISVNAKVIELDVPHYVHNYAYKQIAIDIVQFLSDIS